MAMLVAFSSTTDSMFDCAMIPRMRASSATPTGWMVTPISAARRRVPSLSGRKNAPPWKLRSHSARPSRSSTL